MAFSAWPRIVLQSWDRFVVPYPFARGVYVWGPPLCVPPELSKTEAVKFQSRLAARLDALTAEADRLAMARPGREGEGAVFWLYSVALGGFFIGLAPAVLAQMLLRGKYRRGIRERLGAVAPWEGVQTPIWLHAVSVGEVMAAVPLARALRARRSEIPLLVSTTTETGRAVAEQRLPAARFVFFPLDFGWAVRRALGRLRPRPRPRPRPRRASTMTPLSMERSRAARALLAAALTLVRRVDAPEHACGRASPHGSYSRYDRALVDLRQRDVDGTDARLGTEARRT